MLVKHWRNILILFHFYFLCCFAQFEHQSFPNYWNKKKNGKNNWQSNKPLLWNVGACAPFSLLPPPFFFPLFSLYTLNVAQNGDGQSFMFYVFGLFLVLVFLCALQLLCPLNAHWFHLNNKRKKKIREIRENFFSRGRDKNHNWLFSFFFDKKKSAILPNDNSIKTKLG